MITTFTAHTSMPKFRGDEQHVHGPNCKHNNDHAGHDHNHDHHDHDHADQVTLFAPGKAHAHEGHNHAGHNHDHHDHEYHHPPKPGDQYKNPIIRAIVNFFGWFYELGKSFVHDITDKKPDDDHAGHQHSH